MGKVGERFRALPFFPTDRERLDVIGRALEQDRGTRDRCRDWPELARMCAARGLTPTAWVKGFAALAQASYPLHPVTLLALPTLFRRAGQSHRTCSISWPGKSRAHSGATCRRRRSTR